MTLSQLEKKARQLLYRKRLADTVESLEDSIRIYMQAQNKDQVKTGTFIIRLAGDELLISFSPEIDKKQLRLRLKQEC